MLYIKRNAVIGLDYYFDKKRRTISIRCTFTIECHWVFVFLPNRIFFFFLNVNCVFYLCSMLITFLQANIYFYMQT